MFFLFLPIELHKTMWIVAAFFGDRLPNSTNFFYFLMEGSHNYSSVNSNGVTSSGVGKLTKALILRMCPNLLALARCWQFQVSK